MSVTRKFFFTPFAEFGTTSTIPDGIQSNGSVSYFSGFGPNYSLPLAGGGSALPVPRTPFNGLMNDITGAIQDVQLNGIPTWIGSSPQGDYTGNWPYAQNQLCWYISNTGTVTQAGCSTTLASEVVTVANATQLNIGQAISGAGIAAGAVVQSIQSTSSITMSIAATVTEASTSLTFMNNLGFIWQSLVNDNTDVPGSSGNWLNLSLSQGGPPIGSSIAMNGIAVPDGYLLENGTSLTIAGTYWALFNAITSTQSAALNSTTLITVADTTGYAPGMFVAGIGIPAGATILTVPSGTTFTISAAATQTSTQAVTVSPYAVSLTNFSIPNSSGLVTAGSGTTNISATGAVGSTGGALTSNNVPAHTHAATTVIKGNNSTTGGTTYDVTLGSGDNGQQNTNGGVVTIETNAGAAATPLVQPTIVKTVCIRYR